MAQRLLSLLPQEAFHLVLVFFLSFLIGLEREELKQSGRRAFGGVRTFPLVALMAYTIAYLSQGSIMAVLLGFCVVASFMVVSYWFKQRDSRGAGITTELSGLVVYLMGAAVFYGHIWFACTLVVANLLLLELKDVLERLAEKINGEEIVTFAKFLMLSAVVLPLVPNQAFGPFAINPFKTWLVVVAVSAVSYGSYLLQKVTRGRGGIFLAAVLGGAYSSTVTTVVLAKRAREAGRPHAYSGAILAATGLMYIRVVILVGAFNLSLARGLAPVFLSLAFLAILVGWVWSRRSDEGEALSSLEAAPRNPLQLRSAFGFALVFLVMLAATRLAVIHLGRGGVYTLAAIMGLADVDPFIMGLTQGAGNATPMLLALVGITIATSCNNLAKAGYALGFADRRTGRWAAFMLVCLSLLGMLLVWGFAARLS
ncbi:MgtC/SapB family protein [Holophaga foetida]|uniref:MgtC/SapB family protein n=1 Tax=Holophaga foetida TaxID=35839 RepID=UPI000247537C|nr:MgtC/SapB family protein [Holophaga foetida]